MSQWGYDSEQILKLKSCVKIQSKMQFLPGFRYVEPQKMFLRKVFSFVIDRKRFLEIVFLFKIDRFRFLAKSTVDMKFLSENGYFTEKNILLY